jgi:dUTP pyrophosphatase
MLTVKIKKLSECAVIPQYATPGSSGFDLVATEDAVIRPGETKLVKTGLSVAVPQGYELQVRPRSGVSLKTSLRVANSPGTVDSDYRGEVCVIVSNTSSDCFDSMGNGCGCKCAKVETVLKGTKIAQGVICPVIQASFEVTDSLDETIRGAGGFGSTGVNINDPKNAKAVMDKIRRFNNLQANIKNLFNSKKSK